MTQVTVRGDLVLGIISACTLAGIRSPRSAPWGTGNLVQPTAIIEWSPDLSAPEQATVDSIVKLAVGATLVTKAERDNIESQLATGRLFQQLSQNDFIALAQNARDRQLFDNVTALWRVVRVLLRD